MLQDQSGEWFELEPPDLWSYKSFYSNPGTDNPEMFTTKLCDESRKVGATPMFFMDWNVISSPMNPENMVEVDRAVSYGASYEHAMSGPFGLGMVENMPKPNANGQPIGDCVFSGCTDAVHPSALTQYTNACIMYSMITGKSPIGLPDSGSGVNHTMLQESAWKVYTTYKARETAKCGKTFEIETPKGPNWPLCVAFNDDNGEPLPTPATTPMTTVTATTVSTPAPEECTTRGDGAKAIASILAVSGVLPQQGVAWDAITTKLGAACDSGWKQCFNAKADGWSSAAMHTGCDQKGPLFVAAQAGERVFGGYVPVSTLSSENMIVSGGVYVWRVDPGTNKAQAVDLISEEMKLVWDFPDYCAWLGYREDFKLGSEDGDCRQGKSLAFNPCTDFQEFCGRFPKEYDNDWLTGGPLWNATNLEIYYNPEIADGLPPPPPPTGDESREKFDGVVQCLEADCPSQMNATSLIDCAQQQCISQFDTCLKDSVCKVLLGDFFDNIGKHPSNPRPPDMLPDCDFGCKPAWEKCTATGSRTPYTCIHFAANGYLCYDDASPQKCDASWLLKQKPLCPSDMFFSACSGTHPTCVNQNPLPVKGECQEGCRCPRNKPIWDDALEQCISAEQCPLDGHCDGLIGPDHLLTGNAETTCDESVEGSVCTTTCPFNLCVPKGNFEDRDKLAPICAALPAPACGRPFAISVHYHSHRCVWSRGLVDTDAGPPKFVCSDKGWVLDSAGGCNTGWGEVAAMCKQLHNSECLEHQACVADPSIAATCKARAQEAGQQCKLTCRSVKGGNREEIFDCAECIYSAFYKGGSIVEPHLAVDTCCGCLESLAFQMGIDSQDLVGVMQAPCTMHDPTNDDDDTDDDLTTSTTKPHERRP